MDLYLHGLLENSISVHECACMVCVYGVDVASTQTRGYEYLAALRGNALDFFGLFHVIPSADQAPPAGSHLSPPWTVL